MINWLKWLVCWFNKSHVFAKYTKFVDTEMVSVVKCVRCGYEHEQKSKEA